nr:zinc finger, CCHC-type [Tanacetum cinerariifolium]
MTIEEAIGRLKTYEERIKYKRDKQMNSQESLMFAQHGGKRKPFREYGHGGFNQSRGREQDKNDYQSKGERVQKSQRVQKPQRMQKTAGSAKNSKKLINVIVSVKGSKDEDK